MSKDRGCDHQGSIVWNPFNMAVECSRCKEQFFKAHRVDGFYVLKNLDENLDFTSQELVRDLAQEMFRAVRSGDSEMTAIEAPLFEKMAQRSLEWLQNRARIAREGK